MSDDAHFIRQRNCLVRAEYFTSSLVCALGGRMSFHFVLSKWAWGTLSVEEIEIVCILFEFGF